MRRLARVFGISRKKLKAVFKTAFDKLPKFEESIEPEQADDILELDELWSFVASKKHQIWLWIALCRRTRQVVAYTLGDRSAKTCQVLYKKLPDGYKQCQSYSDFWKAYQKAFPKDKHQSVGKESGQTSSC